MHEATRRRHASMHANLSWLRALPPTKLLPRSRLPPGCSIEPRTSYSDRLFTTGEVGGGRSWLGASKDSDLLWCSIMTHSV